VGGVDGDADAQPPRRGDRAPGLAVRVGVVGIAVSGARRGSGKLAGGGGDEVDRIALGPGRDGDRRDVGRRKERGSGQRDDAHAGKRQHELLDEVVRHRADAAVVLLLGKAGGSHDRAPPSASIGLTTPRMRTMTMCTTTRNVTPTGSSMMCSPYIWPKLRTLKNAPIPAPFMASLAFTAMNCEAKFCCERYPVKAVRTLMPKMTTPIIHVAARPCRQLAMKYWPQRRRTIAKKNSCTDQKWRLLKNRPRLESCHHCGPMNASTIPLT